MTIKVICDGTKCDNYFLDAYAVECPVGWARVQVFSPGQSNTGHMCPQCWSGDRAIDFTKNQPWLLLGKRHA